MECVGEVMKRATAREGCSREPVWEGQEDEGDAGHLECSVLTLTLNEMRTHRVVLRREMAGPDIML